MSTLIPSPVRAVFSIFPLVTFPSPQPPYLPAPSKPTLWLLKPSSKSLQSLNILSRTAQTYSKFLKLDVELRWWDTELVGPGEKLPCLHLPDGQLLGWDKVPVWMREPAEFSDEKVEFPEEEDAEYQAYEALIRTKLFPAVLASQLVYGVNKTESKTSMLSSVLHFLDFNFADPFDEVRRLSARKVGYGDTRDELAQLQAIAIGAINALENRFREENQSPSGWLFGSKSTYLDAHIYALLSIILESRFDKKLKEKIQDCTVLMDWMADKKALAS